MSMKSIPQLLTPLLYRKTAVCRGIPIFLIFDLKHRLWVHVRTASKRVPTMSENNKTKNFPKFSNFIVKKNLCILHGQNFVMRSMKVLW